MYEIIACIVIFFTRHACHYSYNNVNVNGYAVLITVNRALRAYNDRQYNKQRITERQIINKTLNITFNNYLEDLIIVTGVKSVTGVCL